MKFKVWQYLTLPLSTLKIHWSKGAGSTDQTVLCSELLRLRWPDAWEPLQTIQSEFGSFSDPLLHELYLLWSTYFLVVVYIFGHVLTPQSHEDGEEDSGCVVKQMAGSGCATCCDQLPVAAGLVAQWTHGNIVPGITNFHADKKE